MQEQLLTFEREFTRAVVSNDPQHGRQPPPARLELPLLDPQAACELERRSRSRCTTVSLGDGLVETYLGHGV